MSSPVLVEEIPYIDPLGAYHPFSAYAHAHLLDPGASGRYAFIAPSPYQILSARGRNVKLNGFELDADPFDILADQLARCPMIDDPDLPPFQGGVVGYFGYELAGLLERLPDPGQDELGVPDMVLGFYDAVIALDTFEQRAWIISTGLPETDPDKRARLAAKRLNTLRAFMRRAVPLETASVAHPVPTVWESNFDRRAYEDAVRKVVEYIWAGDIFQANLARRLIAQRPAGGTPFEDYRRLNTISPAPHGAYLRFDDFAILSNSPERFLSVRDGIVETKPIKGTRPRGGTPVEDARNAQDLLSAEKDRSENVMIVDLLRNDVSRVCAPGSVSVPKLCALESYANVHHLVSTVTGRLADDKSPVDLLKASFPGGSITGAPKIRAMEIITELEGLRRGAYCGGIGYIGFNGTMDLSIAIRTLTMTKQNMSFHVGGGIVADSDPASEYEETCAKAAKLLECFGGRTA